MDSYNLDKTKEVKEKARASRGVYMKCGTMNCGDIEFRIITNKYPNFILECTMCETQYNMVSHVKIKAKKRLKRIKTRRSIYE